MTELPVREMVLYKHGVGFFVRAGQTGEPQIALTFRKDEINDVLKSLSVFDRAGGQVLGIHYQTPMDQEARLASSSIRLSDVGSERELLRDLRGRKAVLTFEIAPGSMETLSGRVVGIDDMGKEQNRQLQNIGLVISPDEIAPPTVVLLAEDGEVHFLPLASLRRIRVQDSQSARDLTYFLDTSMSEDDRRTVYVRMSDGEHDLYVAYVAPSPTWRVSYRIVAESDEAGETGKALLQGWGLFDNRLEEDLNDVQVTLVAGQPISFIYELYASRIPVRPTVQDESRIAPGPVEFAGALPAYLEEEDESVGDRELLRAINKPTAQSRAKAAEASVENLKRRPAMYVGGSLSGDMAASTSSAEAKDMGEFFQYVVTTPVSIKRGESALVPIINNEVKYHRELLYNGQKLPDHPVVSLRFDNGTGLTLERGPVTVVEDSDYKGEAVVPFTKDGNQVYLPYAVELGVKITERTKERVETIRLRIQEGYIVYDQYQIWEKTYLIENTTPNSLTITLEANINSAYELFDTPTPDVETANERRWRVEVGARAKAEFVQKLRRRGSRQEQLVYLDHQKLQEFMKNRWLDDATLKQLRDLLNTIAQIDKLRAQQTELDTERQKLYNQQEQLRKNMQALSPSGDEAAFRKRIVGQLETSQNRVDEIDREMSDLSRRIKASEQQVSDLIAGLGS